MEEPTALAARPRTRRPILGRIAPGILILGLVLDGGLRLLPRERFAYRAWEAMSIGGAPNGGFRPDAVYDNPRSYGDLSNLSNRSRFRQYRRERFTTDRWGRRNPGPVATPFHGILVLGDSFAVGSGVSDEFTLSEQLRRTAGVPVYNGARATNPWRVINDIQMQRGLVIWQQSERADLPTAVDDDGDLARVGVDADAVPDTEGGAWHRVLASIRDLVRYSPLRILAGRVLLSLQNDVILPNPYRAQATVARLRNGHELLFLPSEVANAQRSRPVDTAFFRTFRRQLNDRGLDLLVLLVPDKYVVYQPLLQSPTAAAEPPFMDRVEQALVKDGIPVVNLTELFREKARERLSNGAYIYWDDDTHWNGEGINEAAAEIARSPSVGRCECW